MKMSQRRRMAKKTPQQLARYRKRKAKDVVKREQKQQEMADYLRSKGWKQSGPLGDVWSIDNWKPHREILRHRRGYYQVGPTSFVERRYNEVEQVEFTSERACMTLAKAYRCQLQLDAAGYERPVSLDDDLVDQL